jgi:peptidoglycan L-alanyl-D-glutamate endopeptidase CwlK
MTYILGKTSRNRLTGVHVDLVSLVERAIKITEQDFTVIEGLRTRKRQRELFNRGATTTMNSRHLTGHAVDLAPWPISWDWDLFYPIGDAMIAACQELNTPLRWGGNWQVNDLRNWKGTAKELARTYTGNFPDGPHFELPRGFY